MLRFVLLWIAGAVVLVHLCTLLVLVAWHLTNSIAPQMQDAWGGSSVSLQTWDETMEHQEDFLRAIAEERQRLAWPAATTATPKCNFSKNFQGVCYPPSILDTTRRSIIMSRNQKRSAGFQLLIGDQPASFAELKVITVQGSQFRATQPGADELSTGPPDGCKSRSAC